ncbi:pesticin C-terminus-like muramidase [Alteromonas halophila]|uniref:Peptidoglycan binding-like domain-containing protein n=1 Tax=Alteromonas halophila TaxID=516698 RepID=A0A918JQJ1_9ALTE|nr:pesticin C-terminus-like muramidase [Alteromonas halophila]GGW93507.1 hypothetical protein GCM10007391_29860 [Alteromonas halophila]
MLSLNDGFNHQRPDCKAEVRHLQRLLRLLGENLEADGFFGQATQDAVIAVQKQADLTQTGVVDDATWQALERTIIRNHSAESTHAENTDTPKVRLRDDFRGDLAWIHAREGHAGKPYWPGGASGVTLDPGFDLGQQEPQALDEHYQHVLTPQQLSACHRCIGLKGKEAKSYLSSATDLADIRLSTKAALDVFPAVVAPYWAAIVQRFPALANTNTPGAVQTALLSLAFNRGPYNRDLASLSDPINASDWQTVADNISAMQQNHSLAGIRKRRRMEGEIILAALS